jgi:hypothetical protein
VKADLPSLSLTRRALEEIASKIDNAIGSEDGYSSFEISGRQFDVEVSTAEDLGKVDWPDSVERVYFYKKSDVRKLLILVGPYGHKIEASGNDTTWVHGALAEISSATLRSRSLNGFLSSPWVVIPGALASWVVVSVAVWAALAASGADMGEGEPARTGLVFFLAIYAAAVYLVAILLPGYLFPRFEFRVSDVAPTHVRLRAHFARVAVTLIVGVISSLMAYVITAVT